MINYATISSALQAQLLADATVAGLLKVARIERGGFMNVDADNTPWVGVYRGGISYAPRTLGSDQNWEATPNIRVIAQTSDLKSGERCEDSLEALVKAINDAILTDTTIGGTVDIVTGFDVEYSYREDERTSVHFQQAIITIGMEVATQ